MNNYVFSASLKSKGDSKLSLHHPHRPLDPLGIGRIHEKLEDRASKSAKSEGMK